MNKFTILIPAAALIAICVAQLNHNLNLHKELEKTEKALQISKAEKQAILATLDNQNKIEQALRDARRSAEEAVNGAENLADDEYFDTLMRVLRKDFGACDTRGRNAAGCSIPGVR